MKNKTTIIYPFILATLCFFSWSFAQDIEPIRTLTSAEYSSRVVSIAFSSDGKLLASGSYDNTIRLWRVNDGKLIKTLSGHQSSVTSITFNPDGELLASGSRDRTIRLWWVSDGKLVRTFSGHKGWVRSVAFSPDGKLLASGSWDKTIRLWRVNDGELVKLFSDDQGWVSSVAFSPDGKLLANGSDDQTIRLWRVSDGELVKTLTGHQGWVLSVAFSPDGKLLASGSWDRTIRLWRVNDGELVRTLSGHQGFVSSVAFSLDGKLLASGSSDKTVRLWRVNDGKLVKTLSGHQVEVLSVAFSPDGMVLASGDADNMIKLWDFLDIVVRYENPDLFLPKGEFETSSEYAQRINRRTLVLNRFREKLKDEWKARKAKKEQQLQINIAKSLEPVKFAPTEIGKYDADNETFPITIESDVYLVKIPRSEARSFKQNSASVRVAGYRQLTRDLRTYEYFNMAAIHPVTGSRFPFGPTKEIDAAPIMVSKKAVVPPELTMRVAFVEVNNNGFLDAEEAGKVKVSITNHGQGAALGVVVHLQAKEKDEGVRFEASQIIGEIPVGQTRTAALEVSANRQVARTVNQFTVTATESYGFPPDPVQLTFETFPFIPPSLELVDFGINTATGENVIRPGVVTEVQARVQNRGQGPAEGVQFNINLPGGVYFTPGSRTEYSYGALKPGEFKDLEFSIIPNKEVGNTIEIAIGYVEKSTTGSLPLKLEVEKPQRTIRELVVKGQELAVEMEDVATISVDIERDIPTTRRRGKRDLAIVFGIENYKNVPGVSFARRDAQWMKEYFKRVLGLPENRIYYQTDSDVSLAAFRMAFGGWLEKRLKKDSNIFIYYAGHGAPDIKRNKAYLIPYDGDPDYAADTGYSLETLYSQLGKLDVASVTIFLDACFSGANRNNEMLLADARPVFMEVNTGIPGNVTVFSAAGGKEISSAWPEKKHGLFSYFLMKGMAGAADANGDRKITVGELGDYVSENVSDTAGMLDREQTPRLQTVDREKVLISY